jgi:hypothetical protein
MTPLQGNLSSCSSILLGLAVLVTLTGFFGWCGFIVGIILFFL